jgi:uncharacterized protein YecE (DUF72 family)
MPGAGGKQVSTCPYEINLYDGRTVAMTIRIRFHGDPAYGGDYPRATLSAWARRIADWRSQGLDVFVYFNNDVGGYALHNTATLKHLLAENVKGHHEHSERTLLANR